MKASQRHKDLETVLVLVLALGLLYWKYKKPVFLLIALVMGLAGLLVHSAARWVNRLWTRLAEGIGFVMNTMILSTVFIAVVIPLGWISRKLGKSSVKLKAGGFSYFKERNHLFTKEDLENPW